MKRASEGLAEQFNIIPYPFVGKDYDEIAAEFVLLRESGVRSAELAQMLLDAIEILLRGLAKPKITKQREEKLTRDLSDMLGRLSILEDLNFKK